MDRRQDAVNEEDHLKRNTVKLPAAIALAKSPKVAFTNREALDVFPQGNHPSQLLHASTCGEKLVLQPGCKEWLLL